MARTIDYLTLMVDVTPYEHEGNNYNALHIIVAYRKGQGFVITWQPVSREPMGYKTGPLPSRELLVGGAGFVVKEATRNNVKTLEQMYNNLKGAVKGIKSYFDQRDFDGLKNFMGDVANNGYSADIEIKTQNQKVMATLKIGGKTAKNNENVNVQNAQVSNPMMKQFKQLKEKHPNAMLLFRCGDFYETYCEDAAAAADVLGITITSKDGVQMAGFPHHALDTYLPKLIRAGRRVAICDQLEMPKPTVKREGPTKENVTAAIVKAANEGTATTMPISEHGTLVIAKPGIEPKPAEEPAISEQPEPDAVGDGEIVDVTANNLPKVEFSTYTTKKGATAPQIIGFGGPDDPRWKSHKEKEHKWTSASWKKDLSGEKVYILMFGTKYMDAAKALCDAYNAADDKAIEKAEADCQAVYEKSCADGKAKWAAKKAEWAANKAKKQAEKSEENQQKGYDAKAVAGMLKAIMAGGDIPEDIKKLMVA